MKFVVTGGAGFIGSHLAENLVRKNHTVSIIDNLYGGNLSNLDSIINQIDFHKIDIRNFKKLRDVLKNADGVFHEAALTSVPESFSKQQEYYDVNVTGTREILELAKEFGFKVVFASSAAVYGDIKKIPIAEDMTRKPINPYGVTKFKAEQLAVKYSKLNVNVIGLRYFNVYGNRQNNAYAGVISKFLNYAKQGKSILINGDGLQVRDFVSVEDVVRANVMAMQGDVNHAFINIGSGVSTSIVELANMIITLSGQSLRTVFGEPLKGDVRASVADIALAKKLLGWKPKTSLKDWLSKAFSEMNIS